MDKVENVKCIPGTSYSYTPTNLDFLISTLTFDLIINECWGIRINSPNSYSTNYFFFLLRLSLYILIRKNPLKLLQLQMQKIQGTRTHSHIQIYIYIA